MMPPMRAIATLLLLLGLAACSANPAAYGITGPGRPPVLPAQPGDADVGQPGLPNSASVYGPSIVPSTGTGRFWGYN